MPQLIEDRPYIQGREHYVQYNQGVPSIARKSRTLATLVSHIDHKPILAQTFLEMGSGPYFVFDNQQTHQPTLNRSTSDGFARIGDRIQHHSLDRDPPKTQKSSRCPHRTIAAKGPAVVRQPPMRVNLRKRHTVGAPSPGGRAYSRAGKTCYKPTLYFRPLIA